MVSWRMKRLTGASRTEKGPFPPDQLTDRFSHCAGAVYWNDALATRPQMIQSRTTSLEQYVKETEKRRLRAISLVYRAMC